MQSIGRDADAVKTFYAMMNLPPTPLKCDLHTTLLLNAATEVCNTSGGITPTETLDAFLKSLYFK